MTATETLTPARTAFTICNFGPSGEVTYCERSACTYTSVDAALEVPANTVPFEWRLRYFRPATGWRVMVANHPSSGAMVCVAAHPSTFESERVPSVVVWGAGRQAKEAAELAELRAARASAHATSRPRAVTAIEAQLTLF